MRDATPSSDAELVARVDRALSHCAFPWDAPGPLQLSVAEKGLPRLPSVGQQVLTERNLPLRGATEQGPGSGAGRQRFCSLLL